MGDFTFSATAECDVCGAYLSSSDEECDHNGETVDVRVFRRMHEGRDSLVGVETVPSRKWHELKDRVGDDWIAYQYLGTKDQVNKMLQSGMWDGVDDLPKVSMSLDAPKDVNSDDE